MTVPVRPDPDNWQTATANAPEISFTALGQLLRHEAEEHGLEVLKDSANQVAIASPYGAFGITKAGAGVALFIQGPDAQSIDLIRESVVDHLAYFLPGSTDALIWTDAPRAGDLPSNFQFATVLACRDLCQDFLRVTLQLAKTELFTEAAIHFRFVLPAPDTSEPHWPRLKANGAVDWPTGDKALHRPVYTIAEIDRASGRVEVDIFRHEGGRVMHWAETVVPGQKVALMGPGGGGVLDEREVVLCGDETAFPAMARIIRALPREARGEVILCNASGGFDYPIPTHPGLRVQWVRTATALCDQVPRLLPQYRDPYLWCAAQSGPVRDLREALKPLNRAKGRSYLGAFWE